MVAFSAAVGTISGHFIVNDRGWSVGSNLQQVDTVDLSSLLYTRAWAGCQKVHLAQGHAAKGLLMANA